MNSPKVHELKTWPEPFAAIRSGKKLYEIRKDDRDFQVGDILLLKEFDAHAECDGTGEIWVGDPFPPEPPLPKRKLECCPAPHGQYSGHEFKVVITYKTEGGKWGLPDDLCVLSVAPANRFSMATPIAPKVVCTKTTGVPCWDKAKPDEPVFVLRAQDLTSATVICEWIKLNVETAPHEKLRQALESALAMSSYGRVYGMDGGYETKRKKAD